MSRSICQGACRFADADLKTGDQHAAVDRQDLTGHQPTASHGAQDRGGHVVRFAHAAERQSLFKRHFHAFKTVSQAVFQPPVRDETRGHGVHANPRREGSGQRHRQVVQRGLGTAVRNRTALRELSGGARHIPDRAAPDRHHRPASRPRVVERADDVDLKQPLPHIAHDPFQINERDEFRRARAIDQHVQPAEPGNGRRDELPRDSVVGDVRLKRHGTSAQ